MNRVLNKYNINFNVNYRTVMYNIRCGNMVVVCIGEY